MARTHRDGEAYSLAGPPADGTVVWSADIASTLKNKPTLLEAIVRSLERLGLSSDMALRARLCIDEALTNAIVHGNRHDATRSVHAELRVDEGSWLVTITDEGSGFAPAKVPDPHDSEGLLRESGRGLLLMREFMDEVSYFLGGRCVRLVQSLGESSQSDTNVPLLEIDDSAEAAWIIRRLRPGPLEEECCQLLTEQQDLLLRAATERGLILDLGKVTYLADVGIQKLVQLHQQVHAAGGSFTLAGASPLVQEILAATHLAGVFTFAPSVEAAKNQ